MAKPRRAAVAADAAASAEPARRVDAETRPRLHKLRVSNFRCIGETPVEIELDDIVVLVGPNNVGKTSILRAYELVMLDGDKQGHLTAADFPGGALDSDQPPTIELQTIVHPENAPAAKWVTQTGEGELLVRERWRWFKEGGPTRQGWNVETPGWDDSVPWGAANIAQANRPRPRRVTAFSSPAERAQEVYDLLKIEIKNRVQALSKKQATEDGAEKSAYERLLDAARELQKSIAAGAESAVEDVRTGLAGLIAEVFPGYAVTLEAKPEDGLDKSLALFRPELRMGPADGYHADIERQGSGACRTLLWAVLRILADRARVADDPSERPHVLLVDEPELCLHPDAVREACRVIYDLPKSKTWQVMLTTHSPVFIDLARDNTSIVRVERDGQGQVQGTTIFRPQRARLSEDDKQELKLLNLCDPYIAEFFFGGRTVVVEGDTEYVAFMRVISRHRERFRAVHVVRARGKYCIVSLCKVLNQFGKSYAVLHDADRERVNDRANPAWTANEQILTVTAEGRAAGRVRLLASVPNFEEAHFGEAVVRDKPYEAGRRVATEPEIEKRMVELLAALLDGALPAPKGTSAWDSVEGLAGAVRAIDTVPLRTTALPPSPNL